MTIDEVAGKMKMLAAEIGGNHHSPKEAEKILKELAYELDDININMSLALNECLKEADNVFTGVTESYRRLTLKERSYKEVRHENDKA